MEQATQFVHSKKVRQIKRSSSLHLILEQLDWELEKTITSEIVQFSDSDDEWWTTIFYIKVPNEAEVLRCLVFLKSREFIWKSKAWQCSINISVGEDDHKFDPVPISTELQTFENKLIPFPDATIQKIKFEVTLSMKDNINASLIPLEMFIDTSVQRKKIIENNKFILNESIHSDFTFIVQGERFHVHKCVLTNCSPIFARLFAPSFNEGVVNECQINDIEPNVFGDLLNFIYCSELPANLHDGYHYCKLFEASDYYQITELTSICASIVHYNLSEINALDLYEWADRYNHETLKVDAWKIIQFNILENFEGNDPLPIDAVRSLVAMKETKENFLKEYRLKCKSEAESHSSE